MKGAQKEVGRFVRKVTSKAFRELLVERERGKKATADKILLIHLQNQLLEKPIPIPPQYVPLILERIEKPKRGRGRPRQALQSAEQLVNDRCAFKAMRHLLRAGWNQTSAAEAVGRLLEGLTRKAILKAYRRGFVSELVRRGWPPTEAAQTAQTCGFK
jgi:hypothetical protein